MPGESGNVTLQSEALFDFIRETIEVELVEELRFLTKYDGVRRAMQAIVDMPDRLIDLFIRCCLQNHGRLSSRKRQDHFAMLHDAEIAALEAAVRDGWENFLDEPEVRS